MPTQKTVDTRAMLAAGESGQDAIARGAEARAQESRASRQEALQAGEAVGSAMRQSSQFDQQMEHEQARLAETSRANRMGEAIQQDAQDIELADKGLESQGQSRADRLREEMARGGKQTEGGGQQQQPQQSPEDQANDARFKQQSEQPLEVAGPERRTISPTAERTAQEGSKLTTNRMNAQANYMNAVRNLQELKMKGSSADPAAIKRELDNLEQPIKSAAKLFDAGKNADLTDNQWENLKSLAEGNPDTALQQEIAAKKFGAATGRFLQNRVSESAMQFMSITGDMPDGDLVDMASPMMQKFTQNAGLMQSYLRAADVNGLLSGSLGIQSMADRNRMVRKLTARAMLQSMATPKPTGGALIPSQGGKAMNPGAQPNQANDIARAAGAGSLGGGVSRALSKRPGAQSPGPGFAPNPDATPEQRWREVR